MKNLWSVGALLSMRQERWILRWLKEKDVTNLWSKTESLQYTRDLGQCEQICNWGQNGL